MSTSKPFLRTVLIALVLAAGAIAYLKSRTQGELPALRPDDAVITTAAADSAGQPKPPRPTAPPREPSDVKPSDPKPAAAPASTPSYPALSEIRIGSWNIEWLGKPEDRSGPAANIAQDPSDLADCIIASKVDVLGVAEVVSRIPGRPIRSREIEAVIDAIKQKTKDQWEYVLFPGRADGDQLTGILWNTRTVTAESADDKPWNASTDKPWPLPIPKTRSSENSYLWNRPPNAMKFSAGKGKTDFVVVVLHMKADYNGDFAAHRKEEAEALIKTLPELKRTFHDSDIVLTGDTNVTKNHEAALQAFEQAGFFDLNGASKATTWRGSATDHSLVPADQPEFKDHAFGIMSDTYLRSRGINAQEYKKKYSDHYMIYTTIKVMPDDD